MLGSLMGDFVKGPLAQQYPSAIRHGLVLHRRIDTFTDAHEIVARSRARIGPQRRRYAGILIDLFYDHFLALHWDDYSSEALDAFTGTVYRTLLARIPELPERLQRIAPNMARTDWLGSYRETQAIGYALERIGTRLSRGNALLGSQEELDANYAGFEADFRAFFPEVMAFARANADVPPAS